MHDDSFLHTTHLTLTLALALTLTLTLTLTLALTLILTLVSECSDLCVRSVQVRSITFYTSKYRYRALPAGETTCPPPRPIPLGGAPALALALALALVLALACRRVVPHLGRGREDRVR